MGNKLFNEAWEKAQETGIYVCPKCGKPMSFVDKWKDVLVCNHCGYDMDYEHYGLTDEEYENIYPTADQVE